MKQNKCTCTDLIMGAFARCPIHSICDMTKIVELKDKKLSEKIK